MRLKTILISFVIIIMSCYSCDNQRTKSKPLPTSKQDIRVFVDISMSMRGYFRHQPNEGTFFQRFLWGKFGSGLKNVYPNEKIFTIPFGTQLGKESQLQPSQSFLTKFRYSSQKDIDSFFNDTNTKLVNVFQNSKLINNRLFVVITDGIPSSPGGSGPDPRITSVIKQHIIDKGYHIWLLGIRSEYNGTVYPETPDRTGSKASFEHKGMRPVYIWIGSENISEGSRLLSSFINGLNKTIEDDQEVRWIEFPHITIPDAILQLNKKEDINGDPFTKIVIEGEENPYEINVGKSFQGELDIPINISWENQTINYELNLSFKDKKIWFVNAKNTFAFNLNSQEIPKALTIEMTAEPKINRWWEQWSTDDDSERENARRTLYIKELVDILYEPSQKKAGELRLRFK